MDLLLDTNALIWLLDKRFNKNFGKEALDLIDNADFVYVSSISLLEIRIKTLLGKMDVKSDLSQAIKMAELKELTFSIRHADALLNFPDLYKHDPFDRMLIAQAQSENMNLLTGDKVLINLGLHFVLDVRK